MNHKDGPLYFPWVNSMSLKSPCLIRFTRPGYASLLLLLEPRSSLIFADDAYTEYMHGIEDSDSDTILL